MDEDNKALLTEIKSAISKNQKPKWMSVVQTFVIPVITVLITIFATLNKVENKYIKDLNAIDNKMINLETADKFIREEIRVIKEKQDYNNTVIESEMNAQHGSSHIQLMELE